MIVFGFYVLSFCAIFENTQIILVRSTFTSWLISLVYPFIICFVTSHKTEKESKDEELKRVRELMEGKSKDLKEKEKDLIDTNNRLKKKEEDIESLKKKVDNLITENKKLNFISKKSGQNNRKNNSRPSTHGPKITKTSLNNVNNNNNSNNNFTFNITESVPCHN